MKQGKELKIKTYKNYNVSYGSVNNKSPKALYISISSWAEPKNNLILNYSRVIRDIDKKLRQFIYNKLKIDVSSPFVKDMTIVDFNIKESGVKFGKRSFANGEITLFTAHDFMVNSEYIKPIISELIEFIIESVFERDKHFYFHKKKK